MKSLRLYLDTSVINFLFADDAPEKRDVTKEFFERRLGDYQVAISEVVLFEIGKTKDVERRRQLVEAVDRYGLPVQEIEAVEQVEVDALASAYLQARIVPESKREDALHVAISTVFEYDVLLSWNYRHLANIGRAMRFNGVNEQWGYSKRLHLLTPLEVVSHEGK
jgi:predicted nucleic acid-binding protein